MTTQAQERGGRREEILEAAKALFASRGYRETNLNDVAEVLGFRRQALYYYFDSKEEILFALIERAGQAVSHALVSVDMSQAPLDLLADLIRVQVRQILADPEVFRIQFEELPKMTSPRAEDLRRATAEFVEQVATVIRQGQRDGTIRELAALPMAHVLVGMGRSVVDWYRPRSAGLTGEEVIDYVAKLAIGGARA